MIIEIDGNVHSGNDVMIKDTERQKYLEANGICFLRFTNNEVEKCPEVVIKKIENYIINHPNL